ncbi:hypothetical protein Pmani_010193 [Petrolisthes manimaculis]|uniref:Uncharacterized protein n=1 Tax=Petrolisthes manimaculis TaxID=1843537 RepID=A0AAE1Q2I3_9EUCA|nr:hypothetical protein Pmani_010193 [Petrolisthes manimaculis]
MKMNLMMYGVEATLAGQQASLGPGTSKHMGRPTHRGSEGMGARQPVASSPIPARHIHQDSVMVIASPCANRARV